MYELLRNGDSSISILILIVILIGVIIFAFKLLVFYFYCNIFFKSYVNVKKELLEREVELQRLRETTKWMYMFQKTRTFDFGLFITKK